jgi:membrane-associated phospholipid phosphatase
VGAAISAAAFGVTTALVTAHLTRGIDRATGHLFRPDDDWGPTQLRFDHVVEGLRPERLLILLAAATVLATLLRRSWSPLVLVVPPVVVTACITWAVKVAVHRPDPNGGITDTGGSYPSGHMIALIVCGGLCVLLVRRTRWWLWCVVVALAGVMAVSLLVTTAHWLTDIVGGTFLGLAVIAATVATGARRWASDQEP